MVRCTWPAISLVALGAVVIFIGQMTGKAIIEPSAKSIMDDIKDVNPPLKSFTIPSDDCQGINAMMGIGIFYDESVVKTACDKIKVNVTFVGTDGKSESIKFHSNCTSSDDAEPQDKLADVSAGGHLRQRGTFYFKTASKKDVATKTATVQELATESPPALNGPVACAKGKYHVEASEPVSWIDMNRMMMAAMGGMIGILAGAGGALLSCCCGACCCGIGGIVACTAKPAMPAVMHNSLLEGQEDSQMQNLA